MSSILDIWLAMTPEQRDEAAAAEIAAGPILCGPVPGPKSQAEWDAYFDQDDADSAEIEASFNEQRPSS